MEKCNQSEKAVEYIANQIEKLEKNVNEYNYNINSIELELNALCNKMDEIINKGDKTQELFNSTNANHFKEKEYNSLQNKKSELEGLKAKKKKELNEIINSINEMKDVINISKKKTMKMLIMKRKKKAIQKYCGYSKRTDKEYRVIYMIQLFRILQLLYIRKSYQPDYEPGY